MEPTYFAQYRGFEFQCSPQRIGANAFTPRLVVYDAREALTLEIPLGVPTSPFTDPTAAAHQAFAHGRRWVDGGFDLSHVQAPAQSAIVEDAKPLLSSV